MHKAFIIACLLGLAACAPKWHQLAGYTFEEYIQDFEKNYTSEELTQRKEIFEQAIIEIIAHNRDHTQTYKQGVNRFTDMTKEEFVKHIKGYQKNMKDSTSKYFLRDMQAASTYELKQSVPIKENFDWIDEGVLTPVKDQKSCGSCWAFSSVAAIESHAAINSGKDKLRVLSPQQVVSCMANPYQCGGSGGCGGAISELAFNYVQLYGITDEVSYPYTSGLGKTGTCLNDQTNPPVTVELDGYIKLPANSYDHLLQAIATEGPIVVSVDASAWSRYAEGVFNGCDYSKNIDINHAVTLTGYGIDSETGAAFWRIRNSWGPTYGEDGFIRIAREAGDEAHCGIDSTPADGTACLSQTQNQKVCGQCGVLFDSAFPLGARVVA